MKQIVSFLLRRVPRKYLQLVSHFGLKIFDILYRGNRFEDPITGITYRKLLPYGRINTRENALSPGSLSLERHRLMWLFLKEKTNFFTANLKVLHIAPEYPFINRFEKLKNLDYITADIESPLAKIKMDIHEIPFDDNTFDVIFCNHVLEHVDNDLVAMKEMYRVMKQGGWGIIQSPIDTTYSKTFEDSSIISPSDREKAFGQDDHQRIYGTDYADRLRSAGFLVREDQFVKSLGKERIERYALMEDEIIFYCYKNQE